MRAGALLRFALSGGYFTRLESDRDFSVGVSDVPTRGTSAAHPRAPRPTPRAATFPACDTNAHYHQCFNLSLGRDTSSLDTTQFEYCSICLSIETPVLIRIGRFAVAIVNTITMQYDMSANNAMRKKQNPSLFAGKP